MLALLVAGAILVALWPGATIAVAGQKPFPVPHRVDPLGPDPNEDLVRRWIEVWNTGDLDAVDDLLAPDFVRHAPDSPEVRGPAAERQLIATYLAAFSDLRFTIEALVTEGDTVAVRLSAVGTQRGDLFGLPLAGGNVHIEITETDRIAGDKIAEQWVVIDAPDVMA
jgi:predicted ester cyclase